MPEFVSRLHDRDANALEAISEEALDRMIDAGLKSAIWGSPGAPCVWVNPELDMTLP